MIRRNLWIKQPCTSRTGNQEKLPVKGRGCTIVTALPFYHQSNELNAWIKISTEKETEQHLTFDEPKDEEAAEVGQELEEVQQRGPEPSRRLHWQLPRVGLVQTNLEPQDSNFAPKLPILNHRSCQNSEFCGELTGENPGIPCWEGKGKPRAPAPLPCLQFHPNSKDPEMEPWGGEAQAAWATRRQGSRTARLRWAVTHRRGCRWQEVGGERTLGWDSWFLVRVKIAEKLLVVVGKRSSYHNSPENGNSIKSSTGGGGGEERWTELIGSGGTASGSGKIMRVIIWTG